jgi:hypothetical protein
MSEADETKSVAHDAATTTTRSDGAADTGDAPRTGVRIKPLVLHRDAPARIKDEYHVEELLRYHDGYFIGNAYRALLGRTPSDAERALELDDLRGGRASKVEIIERLSSSPEATARGVRIEGLPSPVMRRLGRVPVLGYALRIASALVRLPVLMQHQQQFEIYALAQQQLIADHVNQVFTLSVQGEAAVVGDNAGHPLINFSQHGSDIAETMSMFSDALLDLSNSHAELQTQTQTQVEQIEAALADLTQAMTAQQQITEALRREQQTTADAQQEFLIQEQRVIIETQKVLFEELREELRALSDKQQEARAEFEREVRRVQTLLDATGATSVSRENSSGQ